MSDPVFAGGGEMGALMRACDWSRTPLGPVEGWSPSLRTMVRFLLANRFPLLLWWGPQYASLYNDAYRPILGNKHPRSLGQPVREVWAEIWNVLQPLIDTPFHGGPSTWMEDIVLEINRHGYLEETHFTIAYSPVPDESALRGIGGVLATVHEITDQVVAERRTATLRDLGARATEAKTAEDACAIAAEVLSAHAEDIPFALLYLIDDAGTGARLAGAAGVAMGEPVSPVLAELGGAPGDALPPARGGALRDALRETIRAEAMQVVEDLAPGAGIVPSGPWSDPPHAAALLPIPSNRAHRLAGVLVAGVSARLAFDERYRTFLELVTVQVATAIANARAYEEERRRSEALAEIDRAKTQFFSNVSHEFRTPLTLLLSPAEDILADRAHPLDDAHRAQLEIIHRNALRLLTLVNTLLDFSRIEAGRADASYQPVDLPAYTAELASAFRSGVEKAGLRFVADTPPLPESLGRVYVDRAMWEKIVLNLLSNAFKHTFQGTIAVATRAAGDRVQLEVRDTGIGVAADQLPHLFERFHRVPNARSRTHEGTGIGLALVQELVRLHGGTIAVTSEEGVGTAFVVSIPAGAAHLPADRIAPPSGRTPPGHTVAAYVEEAMRWTARTPRDLGMQKDPSAVASAASRVPNSRILLADDNADMREYVARLLEDAGWRVDPVADGQKALEAARAHMPDLVLSDVMMPGLDGVQLLHALRSDPRTSAVPVIMLSARAGEEARIEGLDAGADDYLVKPFTARELTARVAAHLTLARARERARVELAAAGARLSSIFAQAPVAIAVFRGPTHICDLMNEPYRELIGHRDVLGLPIREALPEIAGQGVYELLDRVFATKEPFVGTELRIMLDRHGKGESEETFFNVVYQPLLDASGAAEGIAVVGTDVTELVRSRRIAEHAQTIAEEARRDADAANKAKSEFLAAMSHELRTPLNAIAGHVQLVEMGIHGPVTEAQRDALERVQKSQQHLLSLINDVLNFAKLEAGRTEYSLEDVRLAQVVSAVAPMIEPQLMAKGLAYMVDVDPRVLVRADQEKLKQILLNLLSNACKFTPSGGRVTVDTGERGARNGGANPEGVVFLRVSDTGIGIPRDRQEEIFDPFVQVRRNLTSATDGTGLGLSISRDLARAMAGDLRVRSIEGRGSAFTLSLPAGSHRAMDWHDA